MTRGPYSLDCAGSGTACMTSLSNQPTEAGKDSVGQEILQLLWNPGPISVFITALYWAFSYLFCELYYDFLSTDIIQRWMGDW
jgi:hypothetical protein